MDVARTVRLGNDKIPSPDEETTHVMELVTVCIRPILPRVMDTSARSHEEALPAKSLRAATTPCEIIELKFD